ncbi:MAG: ATP phosphoribosyltransferase regulatory subunit [Eubacteriales bacterium]
MNNQCIHTPEGLRDIYGYENYRKEQVQKKVQESITSFGYKNIQTPTFEFLDIYRDEVGTTPINELYKLFDKDGNIMALRPDFTPSIARCASKYFRNDGFPIRLSYLGNTFSNSVHLQGKLNEVTQIGAELIGDDSIYADAEMIQLMVDSLLNTGLTDFQLSIGQVDYFRGVCEEMGLSQSVESKLFDFISTKNYFAAEELLEGEGVAETHRHMIGKTATLYGTVDALQEAKALITNEKSRKAIERLEQLYEVLVTYGIDAHISFDLGMLSKFHYYSGIIVQGYTYGIGEAIVTGGRYDGLLSQFGEGAPAIGFMIVIDDLTSALKSQNILIPIEEKNGMILYEEKNVKEALTHQKTLRNEGWNVALVRKMESKSKEEYLVYANSQMATTLFTLNDALHLEEIEVN